eukprot:scaffold8288_cov129-Cylindrotheca_fusiformis.AAC.1
MKSLVFLLTASRWVVSQSSFIECAKHSRCLEQGFDKDDLCCPHANGVYNDCCFQAECVVYPACVAIGLDGFCCPNMAGEYLDCCTDPSNKLSYQPSSSQSESSSVADIEAACANNPICAALGLNGECCPTSTGVTLDCCESSPVLAPTAAPVPNSTISPVAQYPAQCSSNPMCANLGLEGECCPTTSGLILDCCESSPVNTPTNVPMLNPTAQGPASCSANPVCANLGLEGECCPTTSGFILDCCESPVTTPTNAPVLNPTAQGPVSCSANPVCANLGLEGECCPTTSGLILDCCESSPVNSPTNAPVLIATNSPVPQGPASCSVNPICANLGLEGVCCPNANGLILDC